MSIVGKLFKKLLEDNLSYLSLPIFLNLSLKSPVLNMIFGYDFWIRLDGLLTWTKKCESNTRNLISGIILNLVTLVDR